MTSTFIIHITRFFYTFLKLKIYIVYECTVCKKFYFPRPEKLWDPLRWFQNRFVGSLLWRLCLVTPQHHNDTLGGLAKKGIRNPILEAEARFRRTLKEEFSMVKAIYVRRVPALSWQFSVRVIKPYHVGCQTISWFMNVVNSTKLMLNYRTGWF